MRTRLVMIYPSSQVKALAAGFYLIDTTTASDLRRLFFELSISGVGAVALVGFRNIEVENEAHQAGIECLYAESEAKGEAEGDSYQLVSLDGKPWGRLQSLGAADPARQNSALETSQKYSWFLPRGPAFLPRLWLQKIKSLKLQDHRDFILEPVGFRAVSESCLRSMRRAVDTADRPTEELKFSLILPFSDFDGRWKKSLLEFLESHHEDNFEVICVFNTENPVSPQIRSEAFSFFRTEKTEKKRFAGVSFHWIEARFRPGVFRAGLSRNLGAHFARSGFLLFMDADMRLPATYRPWLWPQSVSLTRRWDVIDNPVRRLKMEKYWEDFNWRGEELLLEARAWKYLCSHSLALPREIFRKLGGFSWVYQSYGHEDTEFGYRVWREKLPVHLHPESSLHFRATADSNPLERQEALQETGFLFLQSHPVTEVAEFAEYLWSFGFRIGKKLKKSKKMAGSLLWKGYAGRTQKREAPAQP